MGILTTKSLPLKAIDQRKLDAPLLVQHLDNIIKNRTATYFSSLILSTDFPFTGALTHGHKMAVVAPDITTPHNSLVNENMSPIHNSQDIDSAQGPINR